MTRGAITACSSNSSYPRAYYLRAYFAGTNDNAGEEDGERRLCKRKKRWRERLSPLSCIMKKDAFPSTFTTTVLDVSTDHFLSSGP